MTGQDIFDFVVRFLAKQGRKAAVMTTNVNGSMHENCVYRGPDGLKCAAGCLLEDSEYHSDMEGLGIEALMIDGTPRHRQFPERFVPFIDLISRLQLVHDASPTGEELRDRLAAVAAAHELSGDVLHEVTFPEEWKAVGR